MNLIFYLGAFALALGLLIVVHEAGHFAVARACGVKVLRFSVGFGKPLFVQCFGKDGTELVLGAFPLGGYVKMLDEREGEVAPEELPRTFNRQSVGKRFAIVLAGPLASFLLAIVCYWALFVHGVEELRPVLGAPVTATAAARAGCEEGELVRSVNGRAVATWQEFRWELLQLALEKEVVTMEVVTRHQKITQRRLDLSGVNTAELETDILQQLGFRFLRSELPAVVGKVSPGSVAAAAGLHEEDHIVAINGEAVSHWEQVVSIVRKAPGRALAVEILRNGQRLSLQLVPAEVEDRGQRVGRIGAAMQEDGFDRAALVTVVSYGPLEALSKAAAQTWQTSVFTLKIFWRMITGDVSWRNLRGPLTIADYAGQSARMGLSYYVRFLALISISLGVLNLLPIPILDGGHLMYYIIELMRGGPVSERAMERGQQIGLVLLAMQMAFAFYNDINRLISG